MTFGKVEWNKEIRWLDWLLCRRLKKCVCSVCCSLYFDRGDMERGLWQTGAAGTLAPGNDSRTCRNRPALWEPVDLHTKCCFGQTWPLWEILLIQIHSNWNGLSWQELRLPRAKSFAWCNVFFCTPSMRSFVFQFLCLAYYLFPPCRVQSHNGAAIFVSTIHRAPSPSHYSVC